MAELDWSILLKSWDVGSGALYSRLSDSFRAAIERGDLSQGQRLPAERLLARDLNVSRSTVVSAYETLRMEGWVESRQGSGWKVRRATPMAVPSVVEREISSAFNRNVVFRGLLDDPGGTVEFLGAHLKAPQALMEEARALLRELPKLVDDHGYFPLGWPALRRAVAAHFTEMGLPTREDEVLITNGAQQAISLAVGLLVSRGDTVLMENPTYLGAIDTMVASGARIQSLPVGPEGLDVSRLQQALASPLRLVYLMPTFHNPTGVVMPIRARQIVARLVEETQIPLIEDLALADLSLGPEPPPPIASFARRAPILSVGSMSKLFWGGLRAGWLRGPVDLIQRIARFKAVADLGGPIVSQALSARLLPRAAMMKRQRRQECRKRLDGLTDLLRRHLPSWSWNRPQGGLLLWVRLPRGNAETFAQFALRYGVSIVPGPANSPDNGFTDHLRLPFVNDACKLPDGIVRLQNAWEDYEKTLERSSARLGVIV